MQAGWKCDCRIASEEGINFILYLIPLGGPFALFTLPKQAPFYPRGCN